MQTKLFHGLIATFVSITVSIPDITLAGNHQPRTSTLSQLELSCIFDKLQERAEHDQRAKRVESDIYNNFAILTKLARLDEHRIAYICLSDNNRQIFMEIQKYISAEESQNDNCTERHCRADNHAFFFDLKEIGNKVLNSPKQSLELWNKVLNSFKESLTETKKPSSPGVTSKQPPFFKLRSIK